MKTIVSISIFLCSTLCAQESYPILSAEVSINKNVLPESSITEVQQQGSYTILGTVIDQSSREPISKAKVSLLGTKFTAITADDGQYRIESIPEGIYQVKAEAEGYAVQIMNNVYVSDQRKKEHMFFNLQKSSQSPPPDFVHVEKQPTPMKGNTPAPVYPEIARRAGIEGTVWLKVWVDKTGSVRKVVVDKSDAEVFNQPTIDAASQWKFEPAMLKGEPTDVWVVIPFKFKEYFKAEELDNEPKPLKTQYPKYPESARKYGFEGLFWLMVSIDEQGNVSGAYVDRLHITDNKTVNDTLVDELKKKISKEMYAAVDDMSDEAMKAVKQWKFSPGIKNKRPMKTRVIIPVKFSLSDKKAVKKK